jgi:enamine deaminase RidA (YjgF/YER057c/UK114 family)
MSPEQKLTRPLANYSHLRRSGDLLFLAGQGCRDPETNVWAGVSFDTNGTLLGVDFEAQVRGVFNNIEATLRSEGYSRKHVIDVQIFLTDMEKQFPTINKLWDEYFDGVNPPPTRTTIGVRELPGLNQVEMKVIACSNLSKT